MTRQIGFAAERASTEKTYERTFAGMFAYVQFKIFLRAYAFTTERTSKTRSWWPENGKQMKIRERTDVEKGRDITVYPFADLQHLLVGSLIKWLPGN